jgi:hypothetical protein
MNTAAALVPSRQRFRALSAGTIVHASIVLLLWLGVFYADLEIISGRWWLLLVWLWLIWPPLLVLHPVQTVKRVAVPVAVGLALMIPCIPTAFSFTAWALGGFAP